MSAPARDGLCARSCPARISSIRSLFTQYPRPIPVAGREPPAGAETCEQCHWPEKFFGAQLKVFNHYAYDETNTPHEVRMLIKTGGGSPQAG